MYNRPSDPMVGLHTSWTGSIWFLTSTYSAQKSTKSRSLPLNQVSVSSYSQLSKIPEYSILKDVMKQSHTKNAKKHLHPVKWPMTNGAITKIDRSEAKVYL